MNKTRRSSLPSQRMQAGESADEDYDAVRHAKREGDFDHLAVAIVTKGADGHLDVDRHDSTAKHGAWGGALTGAAILVAAPAAAVGAGVVGVGTAVGVGGGASVAGLAGAGGLAGHFWRNIPKEKTREMGDLLDVWRIGPHCRGRRQEGHGHRAAAEPRDEDDHRRHHEG